MRLFWRTGRIGGLLLVLGALLAPARAEDADAPRFIAVTFDDLPGNCRGCSVGQLAEMTGKLLASLERQGISATGFVNEDKLSPRGDVEPERVELLERWLEAGHELGNHTFSHPDLHETPLPEFQQDVLRGEAVLRPLVQRHRKRLRYFRHPFLHTGRDLDTKRTLETFLAERGYEVAPVTVDNSEWIFARAYDNALARVDVVAASDVAEAYVPYLAAKIEYYERQSQALLGYEVKQILLLHANRLNADTFDRVARMMRGRGYAFVPLEEALTDAAYRSPDAYVGPAGISWLHRWALTAGRRGEFFAGEPRTPAFVLDEAGVESE